MRNNYFNDDRYDRRSRRGNEGDRWNEPDRYRSRSNWDDNRSSYFGGRDRMDMDYDRDSNEDSYLYGSSRSGRNWLDSGRSYDDSRWNDNYRYSSNRNGNRYDDDDDDYTSRSSAFGRYGSSGRGWFGDYDRHSDASERGWESRRNDRSFGSRDRDRDDDRRSESSRGRGWFGESRRHSDASERGWDNRR